jgi:uncharacterized protein YbjT (DUF2867 family)
MGHRVLVTGANGHLGNNLVRRLFAQGDTVRAGLRDLENRRILEGLLGSVGLAQSPFRVFCSE